MGTIAKYEMSVRYVLVGCRRNKDRIELNPGVKERLKEFAAA
jgi:hypothetical protein